MNSECTAQIPRLHHLKSRSSFDHFLGRCSTRGGLRMLGKTALGKYQLVRSLGRGSNAEVFLAQMVHEPGPPVVIKRVHDHVVDHPRFEQLFEAEILSMVNFSHPYAVRLLEASVDDPIGPCLVMEYVTGVTLEALLARNRILDVHRVGRLLGYFGHALDAAHAAGVIHRDLKPANLMVQAAGTTDESLKVMDFGFAGFTAKPHIQLSELTGQGPIYAIGTPAYVSSEMVRGDPVDHRSDFYSLGCILYEALTGRLPFEYDSQERLLSAHVGDYPPKFSKIGAVHVPPGIEATVQLALAKYPNERQQSCREIVDMYSHAIGEDFWEQTAPLGWEPLAAIEDEPAQEPRLCVAPADPYHVIHEFEAFLPERLAAAKLRGFMEDLGGQVLASEPGVILMRVGVPSGYRDRGSTSTGIYNWFRAISKPSVTRGQEPIEFELHMEKPDPTRARLNVLVAFRPLSDYRPKDLRGWRVRCDKLHTMLRQYLGA